MEYRGQFPLSQDQVHLLTVPRQTPLQNLGRGTYQYDNWHIKLQYFFPYCFFQSVYDYAVYIFQQQQGDKGQQHHTIHLRGEQSFEESVMHLLLMEIHFPDEPRSKRENNLDNSYPIIQIDFICCGECKQRVDGNKDHQKLHHESTINYQRRLFLTLTKDMMA